MYLVLYTVYYNALTGSTDQVVFNVWACVSATRSKKTSTVSVKLKNKTKKMHALLPQTYQIIILSYLSREQILC